MAATVDLWTPPPGMTSEVTRAWRTFYSRVLDVYSLTPAEYRLLYIAQKGRCWICRVAKGVHPDDPKGRGSRRLGVDHDHVTGAVRGLLCTNGDKTCNRVIGWLNAAQLQRAAEYVRSPAARPAIALAEVQRQVANAERNGTQLTMAEQEALAVAYLWPDPS